MSVQKRFGFHRSILFWLIIAFSVCIAPMGLAMAHVYRHSVMELESSVSASRDAETQHYARLLGEEILNLRKQQYECVANEAVRRLANAQKDLLSRYDESQLIQTVHSYLLSKASVSLLIDSIVLYLPRYGTTVTTSDYISPWTQEDSAFLQTLIEKGSGGIVYDNKTIHLWASYPFFLPPNRALSNTFIVTTLHQDQFTRQLKSYATGSTFSGMAIRYKDSGALLSATHGADAYDYQDQQTARWMLAQESPPSHAYFSHEGTLYQISWAPISDTELMLTQVTPLSTAHRQLIDYRKTITWIFAACLACAAAGIAMLYLGIYRPLRISRQAFRRARSGDLAVRLPASWSLEFGEWFEQFNRMVADLEALIEREYRFRLLASNAELKQLQYQISPHFLYNTYFILQGLLHQEETEKAAHLAELIGQYLQYIVRTRETFAPLQDELRHAGAYAQIQKLRFGERIHVIFPQADEKVAALFVPRLTLQPLIENAFEHGVKNKASGGIVSVKLQTSEEFLDLVVEDNGDRLTEEALSHLQEQLTRQAVDGDPASGIALSNIHRRIQIAFGPPCGLTVDRSPLGGLRCTARIRMGGKHEQAAVGG